MLYSGTSEEGCFGNGTLVLSSEVVLISDVHYYLEYIGVECSEVCESVSVYNSHVKLFVLLIDV